MLLQTNHMSDTPTGFKKFAGRFGKGWLIGLLVLAFILITIRIALPPVAKYYANDYLGGKLPGYVGHIDAIHFSFFRGAYQVEGFYLDKMDSVLKKATPFVEVKLIDLSVEWGALLNGAFVGELYIETPVIAFTKDKVEPKQVVQDTTTFKQLLDVGMPLDVNRVEIQNGSVRYKDMTTNPLVDIGITNIDVVAENLQNAIDPVQVLPSTVLLDAKVYGGTVHVDTKLNLLADDPTFDITADVKNLNLPSLNNFFKAYGKFTMERGEFNVYAEVAAKDGGFKGYVKPLIKDIKILGPSNKDEPWYTKLWEGVLEAVVWVFKNKPEDQLATKIPLEGRFNDPKPNILYTIFALLRNGFIEALNPAIDYEINIHSVAEVDTRKPGQKFKDKMQAVKENRDAVNSDKKKGTGKVEKKKARLNRQSDDKK